MDRHGPSTRTRGQTNDNERYGPSARARDQSHNNNHDNNDDDHDTYAGDDFSSDSEIRSARDNYHSSFSSSIIGPRQRRRRPGSMNTVSDYDDAIRRRATSATYRPRRVGDHDETHVRNRGGPEGFETRRDTRVREGVHHPHCAVRRETLRREDYSDSESEGEARGLRRGFGMAASSGLGRGGGRGVEFGSRYGCRGPRDHVRGPRRTGDRVDFDDDSESDSVFDVGYRDRRRF